MTIPEMLSKFITSKRAAGATDQTIRWYRNIVGIFDTWLKEQPDQALTTELMEAYVVHLRDRHKLTGARPLADASIASTARALRSFFKWCQQKRLIDASPMVEIQIMKPDPKEPRRATRAEVETLLRTIPVSDWVGLRDFLVIHVIFFGGLRVGELVKLEARHFDIDAEILHVPAGKTGQGLVPMLREVIEAFMAYETHRPKCDEPLLLLSSDGHGEPIGALTESGVRHMLKRRCKQAGLRHLSPHSFRHGLAMFLLNDRRVDASLVQKILRHRSIKTTTGFYARWTMGAAADEFRSKMQS